MEYVYATLILHEAGEEINETNLTAVLESAGTTVSESRVKAVVAALENVDPGATETRIMEAGGQVRERADDERATVMVDEAGDGGLPEQVDDDSETEAETDDRPAGDATASDSEESDGTPTDETGA